MNQVLSQILNHSAPTYNAERSFDPSWWSYSTSNQVGDFAQVCDDVVKADGALLFEERGVGACSFEFRCVPPDQLDLFSQGAFVAHPRSGPSKSFLPRFQFLDRKGAVNPSLVSNSTLSGLLSRYVDTWPPFLKILFAHGEEPVHAWLMVDLIHRSPELLEVARDAPAFFFEASRLGSKWIHSLNADAFAEALLHTSRRDLMGALLVRRVASRHLRALGKLPLQLGGKAREKFWDAAGTDCRFEAFQHVESITEGLIETVTSIQPWMFQLNPKLGRYIDADMQEQIATINRLAARIPAKFRARMSQARSRQEVRACFNLRDYPVATGSPPLETSRSLRPVASRKALKRAALRFQNCALDYDELISKGGAFMYILEERRPVMILLRRDKYGWVIAGAEYPCNEPVEHTMLARIREMIGSIEDA